MRKILLALAAWLAFCGWEVAHAQVGGGFPPAVPVMAIKCTTSCALPANGLKVGQFAEITNASADTRTSTTTLTFSSNFVWTGCGSCSASQIYAWWFYGSYSNSGGAGGARVSVGSSACNTGSGSSGFLTMAGGGTFVTALDPTSGSAVGSTNTGGPIIAYGVTTFSPPGMCFAQNVSSATVTNFNGTMVIQRVQ